MRDLSDLRQQLDAETAHLTVDIPPELIRRRARGVQVRRIVTTGAAAVLTIAALAVPGVLLTRGMASAPSLVGAGTPSPSATSPSCRSVPKTAIVTLGPLVETGATLGAPNLHTQFDVLIGLLGSRDRPIFVVAFRDRRTSAVQIWDETALARDAGGDLQGKHASDPVFHFFSEQLAFGSDSVLDVGLYTRTAQRITVSSGGPASTAHTRVNAETGWTLFWTQRGGQHQSAEQVTLTAYGATGKPQHTVTGGMLVGIGVQNPRDNSPTAASSTPSASPC